MMTTWTFLSSLKSVVFPVHLALYVPWNLHISYFLPSIYLYFSLSFFFNLSLYSSLVRTQSLSSTDTHANSLPIPHKHTQKNDRPSSIWAHLKGFSVCRMLWGVCVNELHLSCEMMAQLGKQKCKVWQFKRMCFVSVYEQHLRDSICIKAGL